MATRKDVGSNALAGIFCFWTDPQVRETDRGNVF